MKRLPPQPRTLAALSAFAILAMVSPADSRAADPSADWPNFARYREANAQLATLPADSERVVFMGDSITDAWTKGGTLFNDPHLINRGIGGQTTPQMLVRFRADVIQLRPRVVVILAGTNDVAGNSGPSTPEMTEDNLASMVDLAQANGIRVVLSSILPAYDYPWRPGREPAEKIVALNRWIKTYAEAHHCVYLDYFSPMVDKRDGLRAEYSEDGVHPNAAGYAVMEPLARQAIERALR